MVVVGVVAGVVDGVGIIVPGVAVNGRVSG